MGIIEVKNLTKRFKDHVILDNVNLDVPENKILGIIGINGSGKTTLLKTIIGFYKVNRGDIFYRGKRISKVSRSMKKEIGYTSQDSSFYNKLTVKENMYYFGTLYGLSHKDVKNNTKEILQFVELEEVKNTLAQNLSGGMQRRLDLACSMIHKPRVLILDEPTEDLDPSLRREIVNVIKKINKQGTTVIITSHLLEDVENLCDIIAVLHEHKVMHIGSVEDLRKLYGKQEEIHVEIASANYDRIIQFANLKDYEKEENKLIVYTAEAEKTLHMILHIIENDKERLVYADIRKPSLGEVFKALTKKK
ncbi:MAG: ABC transporter ATP-binding protein [Candidatus Woesearchaeota archaeon]|nr:ABC transporter ATP-binding protein [Candidatus Woesearchaeota archaeon]